MKKVLLNKYKKTKKDFLKGLVIVFIHFFAFYFYVSLFLLIHYFAFDTNVFIELSFSNLWLMYPITLGPIVSLMMHIIYSEKGMPWMRFTTWLHMIFVFALVPIVALVN